MAFTRITQAQLSRDGAMTLPNQPTISATELKRVFDAPAKEIVAPAVNNLMDELEATSSAASIGAVAPTGRTGASVQAVMNDVSNALGVVEADIVGLDANSHSHPNKALLDSYTQADSDIAQAIADDHTHANKTLLDTYTQSNTDLADAVANKHAHPNKSALDNIGESGGRPTYNGADIGGDINDAITKVSFTSSNVTTEIDASGKDGIEFIAGANVTLTPNAANKTVVISSTGGGGGGGGGDMYKADYDPLDRKIVSKAETLDDGTNALTATITELNNVTGTTGSIQTQLNSKLDVTISNPAQGQLISFDGTEWKNTEPDKSLARYAGAKTFAQLTSSLLIADNVDKFYLCTDGGTISSAAASNWVLPAGSVIPADSHIAVIEDPNNPGSYVFDDFGGYVDISGKADKTEVPIQITRSSVTIAAEGQVRIPATNTNSAIKTTSKVIPVCDKKDTTNTPAKFTRISVNAGYVYITMAEALSNADIGIIVFN